ncbi:MAG: glutamine-hydrolyzing GMP synthase [Verrucomicrobia bacterium]|nr:MAG: glutamine-hydrolyzing GMP synthase [Verrucomicrobiota bacterium]PYL92963.1 MAG: glutamine-hydrolyzing GMP synthase [Verrucomicrobiota bacterium]
MKTSAPPKHSKIVILDFGSQYTQVIARRIRELQVYSEVVSFDLPAAEIKNLHPNGIILSGGPASVYDKGAPQIDPEIFSLGIPVLGICYGLMQMAHHLGGRVVFTGRREYGAGMLHITNGSQLFDGLGNQLDVWNSHGDEVTALPKGFLAAGRTESSDFAAVEDRQRKLYGLQFHPEVAHTPRGKEILQNFVYHICHCAMDWTMGSFIEEACERVRRQVGDEKVVLGLSGGVDSSVTAALLHKAIGDQLTCIFVNNGLLRAREEEIVQRVFGENFHVRLKYVDATERFLTALKGVTDPEQKRKVIGNEFIAVFQHATEELLAQDRQNNARKLAAASPSGGGHGHYKFLAQGTLYPDVIESVSIGGNPAAVIKSHHNVGGLPEKMHFELVEPVRQLFKDEVRQVGLQLGLPKEIVYRQPFPGPGLAVRILGEVTPERLSILREADTIVQSEMKASDWYYRVWQSFAVLLPVRSVGVMGDQRTYDNTIVLRIVESQDGMTADWVRLPYELLARISSRISNEVKGVNRVCFDISSKPPSTIEWE